MKPARINRRNFLAASGTAVAPNRAATELLYEANLLRSLRDKSYDFIYFKDRESRFTYCSNALAQMFNVLDVGELVGKCDRDFFTAERHARHS
jgi:PAS domain-containing protein